MWFVLFFLVLLIFGLYSYRKSKPNKSKQVPSNCVDLLEESVLFYKNLTSEKKVVFVQKLTSFLNHVYVEAVDFELEDLDIVLVGASAVIPIFNFKDFQYPNLSTVLIYPDYFNKDLSYVGEDRNIGGLVGTGRYKNQMILSRKALHHGFLNQTDKGNTGVHEFVHLLDMLDGNVDGVPEKLMKNPNLIPWLSLMHEKMEAINNDTSDIRNYGGTKQEEFFAVASEYFFERPDLLKRKHPELYQMLEQCFGKKTT